MLELKRYQKVIVKDLKIGEYRYSVEVTIHRRDPAKEKSWIVEFDGLLLTVEEDRIISDAKKDV